MTAAFRGRVGLPAGERDQVIGAYVAFICLQTACLNRPGGTSPLHIPAHGPA